MKRLLGWMGHQLVYGDGTIPGSLSGVFDITGDSLIGWVQKPPYLSPAGIRVEVKRKAICLTSCPAGPEGNLERLPFALSVNGLFTMAELVQETVILEAVSQYGATGILTLDSATKTELIRAHFGRPAETILDLDFSRNGNARPNLGDGWSHAEERYTWGKDDNSIITFAAPSNLGPYLLRIRFGTFLTPMITGQLLDVYANEKFIGGFVADNLRPEFRHTKPRSLHGRRISK